ncbi:Uncharacterised protein [Serratia proteamaculans]|uniref:hypothetical protein n=1 Tax=Serratia proteamaculans TaxID=28151 RepID=UPI0021840656|nr:hypothetical protein [Serratia proteamaculans]CAI2428924.1 Uncharacterised protein [Serratia proteamaculans]HEJ7884117.1 hypothetical protein [Serratia liquefaciens]
MIENIDDTKTIDGLNVKNFSIHYDAKKGSDVSKHKMNAYDLGMSIVEFAKMINRADDIINKESTLELEVTAPAKAGSLIVEFALIVKSAGALDVMKYLGLSAASASIAMGAAFGVARKLRDKKIISVVSEVSSDVATIELDGEEITCNRTVAALVTDPVIRKAMNEVITQPLSNEGNPRFTIFAEGTEVFEVKDEEIQDFTPLPKKSLSQEKVENITTNVLITQVNFDSSKGWKMFYDDRELSVKMEDESFMARVRDSAKSFTRGDMYEVALSIISKTTARAQRTEYVITRVIRHRVSSDRKII